MTSLHRICLVYYVVVVCIVRRVCVRFSEVERSLIRAGFVSVAPAWEHVHDVCFTQNAWCFTGPKFYFFTPFLVFYHSQGHWTSAVTHASRTDHSMKLTLRTHVAALPLAIWMVRLGDHCVRAEVPRIPAAYSVWQAQQNRHLREALAAEYCTLAQSVMIKLRVPDPEFAYVPMQLEHSTYHL